MPVPRVIVCAIAAASVWIASPAVAQTHPVDDVTLLTILERDDLRCVAEDSAGFVWLCSEHGLTRFDGHELRTFAAEASDLRALLITWNSRFLVGGASGLYEFVAVPKDGLPPHLRAIKRSRPIAINKLIAFGDGTVGCASNDGVMRLIDDALQVVEVGLPSDGSRNVNDILEDASGAVWAAAVTGLYVRYADGRTQRITVDDGLPANEILALALGARPGELWAATHAGLVLIDRNAIERRMPGVVRVYTEKQGLPSRDIRSLRWAKRAMWIGTASGVAAISDLGPPPAAITQARSGFAARALVTNVAQDLWVVSEGGLAIVWNGERLKRRSVITSIVIDGRPEPIPVTGVTHATVQVPSTAKLVEIAFTSPRAEFAAVFAGTMPPPNLYHVKSERVDDEEYLSPRRLVPPAAGVHRFIENPYVRTLKRTIPDGVLTPLPNNYFGQQEQPQVRDVPVLLREALPDTSPSQFDLRVFAYADETGWLTLPRYGQRRAIMESPSRTLSPGVHRFVVNTSLSVGDDAAFVEFTIPAPLWYTWRFPLYGLTAGAGLGMLLILNRRREREKVARVQSRIAADLHDSVGASLSRISILSEVVAQQSDGQSTAVTSALRAIGDNARTVIDDMNDAVWFIDPEVRDVRDMLVRVRVVAAALFEREGIVWRVEADDTVLDIRLSSERRKDIYLVMKEALTNASRHARAFSVIVRALKLDADLRFEVEDDGLGMLNAGSPNGTKGNGIRNMGKRAELLRGTLAYSQGPCGRGTCLALQIPHR